MMRLVLLLLFTTLTELSQAKRKSRVILPGFERRSGFKTYFDTVNGDKVTEDDKDGENVGYIQSLPGFISYNINPYNIEVSDDEDIPKVDWTGGSYFGKDIALAPPRASRHRSIFQEIAPYSIRKRRLHISKRLYIPPSSEKTPVSGYQRRQFPYSNVVRLSSGCTGTLLTQTHVLSAAHCVHNGKDFKRNIEMLKVEVPDKIGYRIHYVTKITVSVKWIKHQNLPDAAKGAYDYAILDLNLPVTGREKFMQLEIPNRNMIDSNMHYLGFFSDAPNGVWESTCLADDSLVLMRGNVVLAECGSETGNSGAAVFTKNARDGAKIIGVLSNIVSVSSEEEKTNFSSIMLLTRSKSLDICAMIYPEAVRYEICSHVQTHNIKHLSGPKRIKPFFG